MSDSEELDIDGGESPEESTTPKRKRGVGGLLPTILKFAAIGIGATIFIVTVCVITIELMSDKGTPQTDTDPSSPYRGTLEELEWYYGMSSIQAKTVDNHGVSVEMYLGYSKGDTAASSELIARRPELRDFLRNYFAKKSSSDLQPEKEERLKKEIQEILNTRYLDTGKIRKITFDKLDVMEIF